MSYKLLEEVLLYKTNQQNYNSTEQKIIEKQLRDKIIKAIDVITVF